MRSLSLVAPRSPDGSDGSHVTGLAQIGLVTGLAQTGQVTGLAQIGLVTGLAQTVW